MFPKGMVFTQNRGFARSILILAAAVALAGCDNGTPPPSAFEASGEVLALSGGAAGPAGACVTCHGLDGGGDGALAPRLAGLDAGYIVRQLEFYEAGLRRDPHMQWIAGSLDNDARVMLGEYYAALPPPGAESADAADPAPAAACAPPIVALYHQGDPARGLPSCASCHGDDGRGRGHGNPPLAGQPARYLERQLRHWRDGKRYGDPQGVMTAISRRLDESEMAALSDYSARLTGGRNRPGLRAACPRTHRPGPRNGA